MRIIFRDVIRISLTLALALYLQKAFFSDGYWLILSAFFGIALQNKFYYSHPTTSILITAFVASFVMLAANIFSYNIYVYSLFLLLVIYFAVSFAFEDRKYWQHGFVVMLYAVLSGVLLTNFMGTLSRFEEVWIGFLVALLIRNIIFVRVDQVERELIKEILLISNEYLQNILVALLQRDYAANAFYYEKNFHACRHRLLQKLSYLHHLVQQRPNPQYNQLEEQLTKLYENILSLGNILLRIEDVAIFEMASKEFSAIAATINEVLTNLAQRKKPTGLDSLSYHIQQLQDANMSGVQLVTKDPVVFFLFIEDWKLLERRFELIAGNMTE